MRNDINALLANWAEDRSVELAWSQAIAAATIAVWPGCQGEFGGTGPGPLASHTRSDTHHGVSWNFSGLPDIF